MIYIENLSTDPYYSFALEYYLLTEKLSDDGFFLFWRTDPTLMVGRNQNAQAEINEDYARENRINVVRRLSGGGTIYTDLNTWQYSYIIRKDTAEIDFKPYVERIIKALRSLNVPAEFSGRNDIMANGRKVSGSAQYIGRSGVIHHGSLLYDTDIEQMVRSLCVSDDKIISKGIRSVRQRVANLSEFIGGERDPLKFKRLMLSFLLTGSDRTEKLLPEEENRIMQIADEKFRDKKWNTDAAPSFQTVNSLRLPGGKVEFHLNIEKGRIAKIKIYGDFFISGEVKAVEDGLLGCRYEREALRKSLNEVCADSRFYQISVDELLDCITGQGTGV